jgi:hypothetical protein
MTDFRRRTCPCLSSVLSPPMSLIRKTSLLQDRSDDCAVKPNRHSAPPRTTRFLRNRSWWDAWRVRATRETKSRDLNLRSGLSTSSHAALGAISSSRCHTTCVRLQETLRKTLQDKASKEEPSHQDAKKLHSRTEQQTRLVEPDGIEPTTSCLQSRRSPN